MHGTAASRRTFSFPKGKSRTGREPPAHRVPIRGPPNRIRTSAPTRQVHATLTRGEQCCIGMMPSRTDDATEASPPKGAGPHAIEEGSPERSVLDRPGRSQTASSASYGAGTPSRHRTTRDDRREAGVEPFDELGSLDRLARSPYRGRGRPSETFPDGRRKEAGGELPEGFPGTRRAPAPRKETSIYP